MSASVQNLGTVLEPERVHVARTAYFAAIKYLGIDDAEFRHIWPPRLDARLARLVIRLAREEFDDPHAICACALAILKGARFTNADFELASAQVTTTCRIIHEEIEREERKVVGPENERLDVQIAASGQRENRSRMRMKAPQWSDVVRAIDDALAAFASNDAVAVELDFVQPRLLPTDQVLRFLTEARDDPFQPTARVSASQAVGLSRK